MSVIINGQSSDAVPSWDEIPKETIEDALSPEAIVSLWRGLHTHAQDQSFTLSEQHRNALDHLSRIPDLSSEDRSRRLRRQPEPLDYYATRYERMRNELFHIWDERGLGGLFAELQERDENKFHSNRQCTSGTFYISYHLGYSQVMAKVSCFIKNDLLRALLKRKPNAYMYDPKNRDCLPTTPDPTKDDAGFRPEIYVQTICRADGTSPTIAETNAVCDFITNYTDEDRDHKDRSCFASLRDYYLADFIHGPIPIKEEFDPTTGVKLGKAKSKIQRDKRIADRIQKSKLLRAGAEWAAETTNALKEHKTIHGAISAMDDLPWDITRVGFTITAADRQRARDLVLETEENTLPAMIDAGFTHVHPGPGLRLRYRSLCLVPSPEMVPWFVQLLCHVSGAFVQDDGLVDCWEGEDGYRWADFLPEYDDLGEGDVADHCSGETDQKVGDLVGL
ncbi:Hypothetical protein D9617_20g027670 [Elsinoe fawcettii]|nr:Hypothetical protein D9617_20g027670 [Elsinoe fawcettii]